MSEWVSESSMLWSNGVQCLALFILLPQISPTPFEDVASIILDLCLLLGPQLHSQDEFIPSGELLLGG